MADKAKQQQQPQEEKNEDPLPNPNYRGKRENFNPNFKHPNAKSQPKQNPKKPAQPTSKTLPGPSNSAGMKNPTPTRDEPIWKESVFGPEIAVRETNSRTTFTPSCSALISVVNTMWSAMRYGEQQIDKQMLVEALRYYGVALMWLRIISLKRANSYELTQQEQTIIELVETTPFNVPEPLYLYYKAYGTIETSSTGQTLIPTFPSLPAVAVNQHGGYYGALTEITHNLYEEVPCLGVVAEGLRAALGDNAVGRYASALDRGNEARQTQILVNSNLLGFEPLTHRREEAKNPFLSIGITPEVLNESPANTAFNYTLLQTVNRWLATTKTFKLQLVNFSVLGKNGSQSQTIIQRPRTAVDMRIVNGEVYQTSLFKASVNEYGIGYYTLSQLYKEPAPQGNDSVAAQTWCCCNYTGANDATTIPGAWIQNRNVRRNLPDEYAAQRFESISQDMANWRTRTIGHLTSDAKK